MGLTIVVGLAFFVGMTAILYFGHEQSERDHADRADSEARRSLADAHHGRTVDEVVFDLEHRIDSDMQDFAASLRRGAAIGNSHPQQA